MLKLGWDVAPCGRVPPEGFARTYEYPVNKSTFEYSCPRVVIAKNERKPSEHTTTFDFITPPVNGCPRKPAELLRDFAFVRGVPQAGRQRTAFPCNSVQSRCAGVCRKLPSDSRFRPKYLTRTELT